MTVAWKGLTLWVELVGEMFFLHVSQRFRKQLALTLVDGVKKATSSVKRPPSSLLKAGVDGKGGGG